jgi:uncharacterized protein (DUF2249 family)
MTETTLTELHQKIDAGVKAAIAEAIERHRRLGESISLLKDGQIVTLTADQIPPKDDKKTNSTPQVAIAP